MHQVGKKSFSGDGGKKETSILPHHLFPRSTRKTEKFAQGNIPLAVLTLKVSMSSHLWRHVSQPFRLFSLHALDKQCFNCPFSSLSNEYWRENLCAHFWTLWCVKCVPWSEEMLSHRNWCNIICSGSFTILWALTSTISKQSPGQSLWPLLSRPICDPLGLPASDSLPATIRASHRGTCHISVSFADRQNSSYRHSLPPKEPEYCVSIQPFSALLQSLHAYSLHGFRQPRQGCTWAYLLGYSSHLPNLEGSSDGHQPILLSCVSQISVGPCPIRASL